MPDAAGPHRLDHIDAMRAIAVLLVMWTHYAELYATFAGSQFALDALQQSVNFGRIGVVIFFGISGMLIPNSLRGSAAGGARRFVIRRVFRLYPAFWLSLPIGYAVYWLLFGHRMPLAGLAANLTMIPTAFGRDAVMSHYWTLETELYFYALCLALHWLGGLHRMRTLCLTCLGLCAAFVLGSALKLIPADALGQYKGMLYHLAIMFWGACFRQAYDTPRAAVGFRLFGRAVSLSHRAAFAAVTAAVIGIAVLMAGIDLLHRDFVHVSASLGYLFGILAFLAFATVLRIRAQVFAWIGRISYSLYLLHGIPLYLIYGYCKASGLTGGPLGLYMALTVPPALALAWASYRLVETAGIAAGYALTPSSRSPGGAGTRRNPLDAARPAPAARDEA
ncbi:acyltransferase family protein [Burkholderia sp. Ac-20379]|uniref:acyltransferase family protein n=1 Tax=Burkholderia sp. Ac-20379 TaxID=2703900 RepID=UPI0019818796|nr:acyltransferase [Burkholderia sp. Ac-20379]MBN3725364.1 acyltransferase [Burkholderia sp. Ac-20379]